MILAGDLATITLPMVAHAQRNIEAANCSCKKNRCQSGVQKRFFHVLGWKGYRCLSDNVLETGRMKALMICSLFFQVAAEQAQCAVCAAPAPRSVHRDKYAQTTSVQRVSVFFSFFVENSWSVLLRKLSFSEGKSLICRWVPLYPSTDKSKSGLIWSLLDCMSHTNCKLNSKLVQNRRIFTTFCLVE